MPYQARVTLEVRAARDDRWWEWEPADLPGNFPLKLVMTYAFHDETPARLFARETHGAKLERHETDPNPWQVSVETAAFRPTEMEARVVTAKETMTNALARIEELAETIRIVQFIINAQEESADPQ